jgi:FkbM family methyltransferase
VAGVSEVTLFHSARLLAQRLGVDVRRFPDGQPGYRRVQLLETHGIDCVFDVGASDGRYGLDLRRFGYSGRIVGFEPLSDAFTRLQGHARHDNRWVAERIALGRDTREVTLNVAGNDGASSSILPMLEEHLQAAPEARYVGSEVVDQRPLDDVWRALAPGTLRPFLKLDVQGYEREVLAGAATFLRTCAGIEVELSFVPLYDGGMLYGEALDAMDTLGFALMMLEPGFTDPRSGRMLQADGVFFREGAHQQSAPNEVGAAP